MKTTIKAHMADVVVSPNRGVSGFVDLFIYGEKDTTGFRPCKSVSLSPDQIGALIFALEAAEEASQIHQHRAASVAHGVDL